MQNKDIIIRPLICINDRIKVSLQASALHYCSPEITGLNIAEYDSIEVGLFMDDQFVKPSDISEKIADYDQYFDDGVAMYLDNEIAHQFIYDLRDALTDLDDYLPRF